MVALTPNYNYNLPAEGADTDLWGGYLNANWTALDTQIKAVIDSIAALEAKALIPVGGLYLSTVATNPGTVLGYGTWVAHAAGRALVGVGNNGESAWAVDDTRGSETHTLLEAEMPAHTHGSGTLATDSDGDHQHTTVVGTNGGVYNPQSGTASCADNGSTAHPSSVDGLHTHTITGDTGSAGSNTAHNNIQPSIAVYVWKRTV